MNTKTTIYLFWVILLVQCFAGIFLYEVLPEQFASHWNSAGEVDGYMSKFWGIYLMPMVLLGMFLIFWVIPKIDPLKNNLESFRYHYNGLIISIALYLTYMHILSLAWNLGYEFDFTSMTLGGIGILLIYIGDVLKHAKRNWFVGIRTPWTLSSDVVWKKTHERGGQLFVFSGLVAFLGIIFQERAMCILLAPLFGSIVYLVIYSYSLYSKEKNNK